MSRKRNWQIAAAVALVIAPVATVATPVTAARPGELPDLAVLVSGHDPVPVKSVTVHCPQPGQSVFGAGGRIIDGAGAVALTAITPDQTLSSVTVEATARGGHAADWSVEAIAVCDISSDPPHRQVSTTLDGATAIVSCPDSTRVTGTGFRVDGAVAAAHLDEVAPDQDLRRVRVHVGGTTPARVTAYAICKRPTSVDGTPGIRRSATTGTDATWPKTVTVGAAGSGERVYGVGASVRGRGAMLTALVPHPVLNLAGARADQVPRPDQPTWDGTGARRYDASDDGELTGYAILLSPTFH
ncbi:MULTISPECIES: hypothetical protein [unclassified Solwaraspora]|uniref:hypothetical protein n=1 Tax=unclassified Solwaraspora TaxID=2627926 RepID=UPI00259BC44E|nr:hypothetical protein [Solwaraspora sp. WMMA2056]WJK41731.1 hypothetical protein O7608_04725 [Solwaraspora sp. WMMA2056]